MAESTIQQSVTDWAATVTDLLAGLDASIDLDTILDQFKNTETLTPTTTPKHAKVHAVDFTITGSFNDIDLTALAGTQDDFDATGLKLQFIYFKNEGTAEMDVDPATPATPYASFNNGVKKEINGGCQYQESFNDKLDAVAGGAKILRINGTATQTGKLMLIFGA